MTVRKKQTEARRVSVRDANQGFSKLIAKVQRGARFVVTKNNRDVARIEPVETKEDVEEQRRAAAMERLKRMMANPGKSTDGWTFRGRREDLHDRSV
jgi:prevent-host-death family protein